MRGLQVFLLRDLPEVKAMPLRVQQVQQELLAAKVLRELKETQ